MWGLADLGAPSAWTLRRAEPSLSKWSPAVLWNRSKLQNTTFACLIKFQYQQPDELVNFSSPKLQATFIIYLLKIFSKFQRVIHAGQIDLHVFYEIINSIFDKKLRISYLGDQQDSSRSSSGCQSGSNNKNALSNVLDLWTVHHKS